MSFLSTLEDSPRQALADLLQDVRAGMLGVAAPGNAAAGRPQPMAHYPETAAGQDGTRCLWFITSRQTDFAKAVGTACDALYILISKDQDCHATLTGRLQPMQDRAKLDELWGPMVAAWFAGGKDDPDLTLLRFDTDQAQIWASTPSALRFGFEVLRANLDDDHKPGIGRHATITLAG